MQCSGDNTGQATKNATSVNAYLSSLQHKLPQHESSNERHRHDLEGLRTQWGRQMSLIMMC